MNIEKIKYVLMVKDMDRAILFYKDILGLELQLKSEYWSELSFGTSIIGLHAGGDEERTRTGLSFQVSEINEAFKEAIIGGATGINEPEVREGEPIVLAIIADPENNEIMLTEYID